MSGTRYVAGFMFSVGNKRAALIRKTKPEWQAGKLNGIGGKIEEGESPVAAMVREFLEETGHLTDEDDWSHFATIEADPHKGPNWSVDFFCANGDLSRLRSPEVEKVEIISVYGVAHGREDMIENLPWLICLALDHMTDGRPRFARVSYSE